MNDLFGSLVPRSVLCKRLRCIHGSCSDLRAGRLQPEAASLWRPFLTAERTSEHWAGFLCSGSSPSPDGANDEGRWHQATFQALVFVFGTAILPLLRPTAVCSSMPRYLCSAAGWQLAASITRPSLGEHPMPHGAKRARYSACSACSDLPVILQPSGGCSARQRRERVARMSDSQTACPFLFSVGAAKS